MKKTIKLTESDLSNLVRKVLKESETKKHFLSEESLEYVVRSGDSLSKIAAKNNTTVSDIASANNISNINAISVGQRLKIPKGKSTPSPKPSPSPTVPSDKNVITSIKFGNLWQNFPKNSQAKQIFPIIFPTPYKMFPDSFSNACATRLSLALNNLGIKPTSQFKTENELKYGGVSYPKGLPITVRAKDTPNYLKDKFGPPSFKGENTQENINKFLKGKKGIFTLTNVPGWSATGHADIFFDNKGQFSCGASCYFGAGGTIQAWFIA
jgi:murein DD-endopeptidase MepM/ murein hydrolase activator NlpD